MKKSYTTQEITFLVKFRKSVLFTLFNFAIQTTILFAAHKYSPGSVIISTIAFLFNIELYTVELRCGNKGKALPLLLPPPWCPRAMSRWSFRVGRRSVQCQVRPSKSEDYGTGSCRWVSPWSSPVLGNFLSPPRNDTDCARPLFLPAADSRDQERVNPWRVLKPTRQSHVWDDGRLLISCPTRS